MEGTGFIYRQILIFKIFLRILQTNGVEHLSGARATRPSGPPANY
jgi:hypothetical protein